MGSSRELWRDDAASEVAAAWLADVALPGPVLVVDDEAGRVEQTCEARGVPWSRWRHLRRGGVAPSAWPPDGPFGAAYLRLPRGKDALEMMLHAVGSRVAADGPVWIVGANDEGIKSVPKRAAEVFAHVESRDARRHCRVLECRGPRAGLRGDLEAWVTPCHTDLPDGPLDWISFPGVFAHGRLDVGTERLLRVLPRLPAGARVLDFACGAGPISMVLARRSPGVHLELLDIDAIALEAARRNVPGAARILASDGWEALGPGTYDLIVSNPPLHAGKGSDDRILGELAREAPKRLTPDGALLLVTQKTVPMPELLREPFTEVRIVSDGDGYRVWRAAGPRADAPSRAARARP